MVQVCDENIRDIFASTLWSSALHPSMSRQCAPPDTVLKIENSKSAVVNRLTNSNLAFAFLACRQLAHEAVKEMDPQMTKRSLHINRIFMDFVFVCLYVN